MRLVTEALPFAGGVVGAGGEVRWPRPTRPGDELRVECEVVGVEPSRSRPGEGWATVRTTTVNRAGEPVQVLTARLLVPRRPTPGAG
jgi:acyl dehydratase